MFHSISEPIRLRMRHLEEIDASERRDGTPRLERLRQVSPDTGRFLALLAACAPEGPYLEIGTSAGYSTLWVAVACVALGRSVTTFEVVADRARLARETLRVAQVEAVVELVEGDARDYLPQYNGIAFCFLDAEKEIYGECYEAVVPRLTQGGLLVADNAISHSEVLDPVLERAVEDERVDSLIVPIGKGLLVCRRV